MVLFKKILTAAIFLIVISAAGVAAFIKYSASDSNQPALTTTVTPVATTTPSVGKLNATSATSLTITQQDGSQKTFSISTSTKVVTQVKSGEVGRTLAEIAPNTMVLVIPADYNVSLAAQVSLMPIPPAPAVNPAGPPVSLTGTVVSKDAKSMKLTLLNGDSATVTVTNNASVVSNVFAGEKGKTYADITAGMQVSVSGTGSAKGIVADLIQLMEPLH